MKQDNTGFWVVIVAAVVVGGGYLWYKNNLEQQVNTVENTGKFLGIF